jgi:hypothetical protein
MFFAARGQRFGTHWGKGWKITLKMNHRITLISFFILFVDFAKAQQSIINGQVL